MSKSLFRLLNPTPLFEVEQTNELVRVTRLPRRVVTDEEAAELADMLTEILKTPAGTMRLWPIQGVALYEIGVVGGLLGPITVGGGKTLISLLAPRVCGASRPLLVVPAKLVQKTSRDLKKLRPHWDVPEFYPVKTYEWLSTVGAAEWLEKFQPDLMVLDEAHKYRNMDAARTRRVRRFFAAHPETKCVAISGTFTKRSLLDYAHLALWALGDGTPLPMNWEDLTKWADAIDEVPGDDPPMRPGMLKALCVRADGTRHDEELALWEEDETRAARRAFGRRLVETPGVVASFSSDVDASLTISALEVSFRESVGTIHTTEDGDDIDSVDAAFRYLRGKWKTPDGEDFSDRLAMFRHARELACGFWYRWDPPGPKWWLEPRKAWHRFVRETLKHSRRLDSEKAVALALPEAEAYLDWVAVRDHFRPNTVPVWIDDSVMEAAAAWAERERGIVWTEHTCVGRRLQEKFGLTYYGAEGLSNQGAFIDDHPADRPLVASIKSNSEGRNLQEKWSTNLVLGFPTNALDAEQLVGRTHRPGQPADEVSIDVLVSCREHVRGFWQAVSDAEYVRDTTGAPQKLLLTTPSVPTIDDVDGREGMRWSS